MANDKSNVKRTGTPLSSKTATISFGQYIKYFSEEYLLP